jgi:hypothetical protein
MNCRICGRPDSRIAIRRNTGLCCELCSKIDKGDIAKQQALDYLWSINTNTALETFRMLGGETVATAEA